MPIMKIVTAVLLSLVLLSAQSPRDQTFNLKNGRLWLSLPDDETRSVFLMGQFDGWNLLRNTEKEIKTAVLVVMGHGGPLTMVELAAMVTKAYAAPENLSLPIGWVVMASLAVQRGEVSGDVAFAALRKFLTGLTSRANGRVIGSEMNPIDLILGFGG